MKTTYTVPKVKLLLIRDSKQSITGAPIRTPEDAKTYLNHLKMEAEEVFITLMLDCKNQVIGWQEISRCTLASSLVHPREVFKAAILSNAYAIFVAHNHPSGNTVPSSEDIDTTRQLIKAGKLLGVPVLDHFVVGNEIVSIRENNPRLWSD